jgi:hypothetical protein
MSQPDPICPICSEGVAAGVPVIFDHGAVAHLDCYVGAESVATLVHNYLGSRPGEQFCYTCLAQRVTRDRQWRNNGDGGFVFESGRRRDSNTESSNINEIEMVAPTGSARR